MRIDNHLDEVPRYRQFINALQQKLECIKTNGLDNNVRYELLRHKDQLVELIENHPNFQYPFIRSYQISHKKMTNIIFISDYKKENIGGEFRSVLKRYQLECLQEYLEMDDDSLLATDVISSCAEILKVECLFSLN